MKGTLNHGLQNRPSRIGSTELFLSNWTDSHDLGTVLSDGRFCPFFSWLFCVGKIDATQEKKLKCRKILNRNGVHVGNMA